MKPYNEMNHGEKILFWWSYSREDKVLDVLNEYLTAELTK